MNSLTDYFKQLGKYQPWTLSLIIPMVLFIFTQYYTGKLASGDTRRQEFMDIPGFGTAGYYEKYTSTHAFNLWISALFFIVIWSLVFWVYKMENGLSYEESAKKSTMVAAVSMIVLLLVTTIGGKYYNIDSLSGRNQLTHLLMTYMIGVFSMAYAMAY